VAPGPKAVVGAPPASIPRISWVAAARDATEPDERWENGFQFLPENCTGLGVTDSCASDERDVHLGPDIVDFQAYEVFAGDKCSPFQFQTRDYQARAQRLLLAGESKQIEKEFWTGALAKAKGWTSNRYLASSSASVVSTGALKAENALACLEQGLADCSEGQRGMIHAPKTIVTHWDALRLVRREGNLILTINDTIVVPGSGYDGSSPTGHAAANQSVWAYATSGIVDVRRGPIRLIPDPADPQAMAQATDRATNLVEWRAYRAAAATWDGCCLLAVEVEVAICPPGGS
jgi:hypothetical protein